MAFTLILHMLNKDYVLLVKQSVSFNYFLLSTII